MSLLRIFRKRTADDENADVDGAATRLRHRFESAEATPESRAATATTLVNEYYDIVTDFYEYGWGQCFHFATRFEGESFGESLARHEHYLVAKGQFTEKHRILDLGCGVGGPARNITRFCGARVTGVNNNAYQISRAQRYDTLMGLAQRLNYCRTDFCAMSFDDESYDGAYAIEATCHASDRVSCFREVYRCLKPESSFTIYEWVLTDLYDDNNAEHRRIRHGIELGNALPTLVHGRVVLEALRTAGFDVVEARDIIEDDARSGVRHYPWYDPLQPNYHSVNGIKASPVGRTITSSLCRILEWVRLAPSGSRKAAAILEEAAVHLVHGGKLGIFTPAYFVHARKPKRV